MQKQNWTLLLLTMLLILACNIPRGTPAPAQPAQPVAAPPTAAFVSAPTAEPTLSHINNPTVEPQIVSGGEPGLTLEPGSGYLFAKALVVHGSDDRDLWWNGLQIVPGQVLAVLGSVPDLTNIREFSLAALTERLVVPVPGEAYAIPTVDGQYVLVRMLSLGAQGELNLEWLYPYAGQVLP